MSLPTLSSAHRDAYLTRLGVPFPTRDRNGLDVLVEAHLRAVPFHNLFLLENDGRDPGLPAVEHAIEGAIRGHGGTCHQLSPPFATLLRALDFDAQLVAGDCGKPGDHLLVVARIGRELFLADVANGQPYMRSFPVDEQHHDVCRYGWHVRFGPIANPENGRTHALWRVFSDGTSRRIWTVVPEPRSYSSFGPIIREHHTMQGFGPFLTGLRVVRMTDNTMLTLRDTAYERHNARVVTRRCVRDPEAARRLLAGPFGMPDLPVDAAFAALARVIPSTWAGWGDGKADPVADAEHAAELGLWSTEFIDNIVKTSRARPLSREDPRVLLAVTLTDRPDAWQRLVASVREQVRIFDIPAAHWGVVVLDNSAKVASRARHEEIVGELMHGGFGVHYQVLSCPRSPISESRRELIKLLASWAEAGLAGLPHPADGEGPVAVWVLDDDKELLPFVLRDGRPVTLPVFSFAHRIARLWRDHPEVGVAVGGNTGAPPIPAHATLRTQTLDLCANVRAMAELPADAPWPASANARHVPDYYYDHSEAGDTHHAEPFLWESRCAGTVRDALLELCTAFPGVLVGQQVTRPLLYAGWAEPTPSTARGGNTLFFDLDALFEVPHPTERIEGLALRRADTAWAALMRRSQGCSVAAVPLPVLHNRLGAEAGTEVEGHHVEGVLRGILAQTWGTVLARLVASVNLPTVNDAEQLVEQRLARIEKGFGCVRLSLAEFRNASWRHRLDVWWANDTKVKVALQNVNDVLDELERRFPLDRSLPRPRVGSQLVDAARRLRGET